MAKKSSKVLLGCGIGCGVIILILIGLGVSGYLFVKDKFKDFEAVENLSTILVAEYGEVSQFAPSDKTISDERIETFLKIRDAISETAAKLSDKTDTIAGKINEMEDNEDNSVSDVFFLIKQGMGSFPQIAEYLKIRNQALLDNKMGFGEYYYIYITSYFSYLKNSPEDGPPFPIMEHDNSSGPVQIKINKSRKNRNSKKYRGIILTGYIQDLIVPMLTKYKSNGISDPQLAEAITKELELLEKENSRLPWKDGLPEIWLKVMEKYKTRLEKSYYKITNPIELGKKPRQNR